MTATPPTHHLRITVYVRGTVCIFLTLTHSVIIATSWRHHHARFSSNNASPHVSQSFHLPDTLWRSCVISQGGRHNTTPKPHRRHSQGSDTTCPPRASYKHRIGPPPPPQCAQRGSVQGLTSWGLSATAGQNEGAKEPRTSMGIPPNSFVELKLPHSLLLLLPFAA